jgi:4-amino-4-deoxy-L-arabinose transferase-like glycosyltransferase
MSIPEPLIALTDDRAGPSDDRGALWRQALVILGVSTIVRLVVATLVPLFPDEAYYWEWSRRLAGGYFDHPPMIAWLIAGGTAIAGDSPLGVRLLTNLAGTGAMYALMVTTCDLAGERAARFVAVTLAALPMAAAGLVLATPDSPLLMGVSFTLFGVSRALGAPAGSAHATRWWLIAGLAIGVAMASKFTGVLVPAAIAIAMAVHGPCRARFREPGPWMAVLIASLVMVPVLLWNAQHDWIAFRFQLGHGLGTSTRESWVTRELRLVGGQLALVTPILAALAAAAVVRAVRAPREDRRYVLASVALFCGLFFVFSATRRSVEANWPAVAWMPALVVLAASRQDLRTAWERRALWLAAPLTALLLVHVVRPVVPLPARRDQVSLAHGWDALALQVDSARVATGAGHVAANRYQDAAMLAWHTPARPLTITALNLGGRRNQYDLWERFTDRAQSGEDLLLVLELPRDGGIPGPIRRLTGHFATIDSGAVLTLERRGEVVGRRRLWHLDGWRGTWPADSTDPLSPRSRP